MFLSEAEAEGLGRDGIGDARPGEPAAEIEVELVLGDRPVEGGRVRAGRAHEAYLAADRGADRGIPRRRQRGPPRGCRRRGIPRSAPRSAAR
jgi:hypothetical protein